MQKTQSAASTVSKYEKPDMKIAVNAEVKVMTEDGEIQPNKNKLTLQELGVFNDAKVLLTVSLCLNHSFPSTSRQAAVIREVLYQAARKRRVGISEEDFNCTHS